MNLVGCPSDSFYFNLLMHGFNASGCSQTWRETSYPRISLLVVSWTLRLSSKWPRRPIPPRSQRHGRFALDPPGNPPPPPVNSHLRRCRRATYVKRLSYSWKPKGNLARRGTWESHLSSRQLPLPPDRPPIISLKSSRRVRGKWRGNDRALVFVRFFANCRSSDKMDG